MRSALWFTLGLATGLVGLAAADDDGAYKSLTIFARALHYIESSWIGDVDDDALIHAAIRGMVQTLDRHSRYFDPAEFASLQKDPETVGGIGIALAQVEGAIVAGEVEDGGPAARASIDPKDRLLEIDGNKVESLDRARQALLGKPGSLVSLLLQRAQKNKTETLSVVRERIRDKTVESQSLEPGVVYLRIRSFGEATADDVQKALVRHSAKQPISGLVLDLRDNPGGLLDQAVRIADLWLEDGVIVSTRSKARPPEVERAHPKGTEPAYPIAVVVNGKSASASEVLAAALKEHNRASLVGSQTYGKGSVQTVVELEDHSALKLTIARYYTPSGRSVEGSGLVPDLSVSPAGDPLHPESEAEVRAALEVVTRRTHDKADGPFTGPRPHGISKP
ncbi:MAG: S41 family peptidase [Myxococcota bacterium]